MATRPTRRAPDPRQLAFAFDGDASMIEPDAEPFPPEGPCFPDGMPETTRRLVLGCENAGWTATAIASALELPLGDIAPVVENLQKNRVDHYGPEPDDAPLGGLVDLRRRDDGIEVVTPAGRVLGRAPEYVATLLHPEIGHPAISVRGYVYRTRIRHGHCEILVIRDHEHERRHNIFRLVGGEEMHEPVAAPTPTSAILPAGPRPPEKMSKMKKDLVFGCGKNGWSAEAISIALNLPLGDIAPVVENLQRNRVDRHAPEPEDAPLGGPVELRRRDDGVEIVTPAGRVLGRVPEYIEEVVHSEIGDPAFSVRGFVYRTRLQHGQYDILAIRFNEHERRDTFNRLFRLSGEEEAYEAATPVPTPTIPLVGTAVSFRDTGSGILVLGPGDCEIGHVDPCQAPVLSRVLDRVTRDVITMEIGKADETSFEVVLHRVIDDGKPCRNVVRCHRIEPGETRQAA